jgi:hypothetical protein
MKIGHFLRNSAVAICIVAASPALAQDPACPAGDMEGGFAEYIMGIEGGSLGYAATTVLGTATGAYQFTYETLGDLGYIDLERSNPANGRNPSFGAGEWSGVVWTGVDGVMSREQFLSNPAAQDRAFQKLTSTNLSRISGSWTPGQVVNGIPLTAGGVAAAAHMLGAGGFNDWAASGFTAAGLNPKSAAANRMTPERFNEHLMNRVARGGCFDPDDIQISAEGIGDIPEIFLMPWTPRMLAPIVMPGQIRSTAI